jgi:hypothetical protein
MNKYLITYDLRNKSLKNYENLYLTIRGLGPWWHYLDSTWIVKSNSNAQQIWAILAPHLLTNDHIFVTKIDSSDKWGWLPQDAWTWLNT